MSLPRCPGLNVLVDRGGFQDYNVSGELAGRAHSLRLRGHDVSHLVERAKDPSLIPLVFDEPERVWSIDKYKELADKIIAIAEAGIQVFVKTESYLLLQYLSMAVEYKQTKVPSLFVNYCDKGLGSGDWEAAPTLVGLNHLAIQKAHAKLYEYELSLAAAYD